MNREKTIEKYLIYENTIGGVKRYIEDHKDDREVTNVYEHVCPDRTTNDAERILQRDGGWRARTNFTLCVRDDEIIKLVDDTFNKLLNEKYKGDLFTKAIEEIDNTSIGVFAQFEESTNPNGSLHKSIYTGSEINFDKDGYSTDIKEFEEKLDKYDVSSYSSGKDMYVHYEHLSVSIAIYYYRNDLEKRIEKAVKRYMRERLTYCLKKGQLIVPDDYLDKGEKGIKEWQELKSSQNKNNSIEKKLITQTVREKKRFAFSCARAVESKIANVGTSWSIPRLTVDGCWNVGKNEKLVSELFNTKDKNAMMTIEDEKILEEVKGHWKNELEKAIEAIGLLKLEDIRH